ncbi:MAG: tRNA pseudouridine(38-40) synthase TruA [Vicinamibacterales bacterium]
MRTLRLTLAYDGTNYVGWQRQASGASIQQVVESAFRPLFAGTGSEPVLIGAGRTDAGVHAIGQVASIRVPFDLPATSVWRALNIRLPADVRVVDLTDAAPTFHAQYDARGKSYRYQIATGRVLLPFERWFVWHMPRPCDPELMRQAALHFTGTHDFTSFEGRGSLLLDRVRTLTRVDIRASPGTITVHVDGDGFLRHMVRILVGTLVDVGCGLKPPESVLDALAARVRSAAGPTAPAAGLTLVQVRY